MIKYDFRRDLGEMLHLLNRRRKSIALITAACVGLAVLHGIVATPRYESEASILLKFGREHVYNPEVGAERPAVVSDRQDLVNSEIEILQSRQLAREVINTIGVDRLYPGLDSQPPLFSIKGLRQEIRNFLSIMHPRPEGNKPEALIERAAILFSGSFQVHGAGKSNVVDLSFTHEDPEISAEALKTAIEAFKVERLSLFTDPQADFLEIKSNDFRNRLTDAEKKLEDFRQENKLFDLAQQRQLMLTQRNELEIKLSSAQNMVEEKTEELAALEQQTAQISETVSLMSENARDPVVSDGKSQLLGLRLKEAQLLAKYLPTSKLVEDVRKEIALVERFLRDARDEVSTTSRSGKNPVFEQLSVEIARVRADLSAAIARRTGLTNQLTLLNDRLTKVDQWNDELRNLQREVDTQEANFRTYQGKLEEARISEELNQRRVVNVSVVQAAVPPTRPSSPRRTLNIALALMFGLGFGICSVAARQYMDPKITDAGSAEETLELPVLATIGKASV